MLDWIESQRVSKTYLEVHLRDVVEPFIHSGFAVARCEACECHFWQHCSRLGVHLPLHVRTDTRYAGHAPLLHELSATHQITCQRSHRVVVFAELRWRREVHQPNRYVELRCQTDPYSSCILVGVGVVYHDRLLVLNVLRCNFDALVPRLQEVLVHALVPQRLHVGPVERTFPCAGASAEQNDLHFVLFRKNQGRDFSIRGKLNV